MVSLCEKYLRILSEYGKIRTRKSFYLDTFYAVCGAKREYGIENMKEHHLFVLFITKILPIFNHKYNL